MTTLPAQAHGSAVVTISAQDPYAIDSTMVKLPSLYLAQYSSKAFKGRFVSFGDIYVALGAEDPEPQVLGKGGDGTLSEPVRFYVHNCAPGYQILDPSANFGKRSMFPPVTFQQALREAGGDPRKVFLQTHYTLTIPGYDMWPVRSIMGSRWGGNAARWINTQLALSKQKGDNPLDLAFQIQTRPTTNESGDFVDAVVGFAKVAAKDRKADGEIIAAHADLLSSGAVDTSFDVEDAVTVSDAPSLA